MHPAAEHDFDFIYGRWAVHNRKLADVTDPACHEWVEFDATSEAYPILDGFGHIDRMYVPAQADGGRFEGFTLRLFNPQSRTWRIWGSSPRQPGVLDTPEEGGFRDGRGVFECDEEINGRPVKVRFEWLTENPGSPRWQQSFSYDAGHTWSPNWTMRLTPAD
jgi:hypothetical protein